MQWLKFHGRELIKPGGLKTGLHVWFPDASITGSLFLANALFNSIPVEPFRSLEFYTPPVLLEDVTDDHLLGCAIDADKRTAQYILPSEKWQFRSPQPAGSVNQNLSGLKSRLRLLRTQTFPSHLVRNQANKLAEAYITMGFSPTDVKKALDA